MGHGELVRSGYRKAVVTLFEQKQRKQIANQFRPNNHGQNEA
jgi:hypothetical protein